MPKTAEDPLAGQRRQTAALHAQVVAISAVVNIAALAMPVAVLQVYDRIIPNHSQNTAVVMVAGVTLALLAEFILRVARSHILGSLATRFERTMNRRAVSHLFATDLKTFETLPAGTHLERMGAIATLRDHASGQTLLAIYDVPFAAVPLALIAYFGGALVAVPLAGMALEVPLLRRYEAIQAKRLAATTNAELGAHRRPPPDARLGQLRLLRRTDGAARRRPGGPPGRDRRALFRGTVIDNITMFQPEKLPAAMVAAERVGIVDTIHAMPHGFATMVGDGATDSLPRGLAQRIAIAHALVQKPRIILFDDANAPADDQGDKVLLSLLDSMQAECAMLFISHRPLMLKRATRIYRLSDGQLDRTPELAA